MSSRPAATPSEPSGPRRLHPVWIVLGAIATLRALALPLLIFLVTGSSDREPTVYGIAIGLAGALMALRLAQWWQLRYEVREDELRVRSGLLGRREQSVPLDRIQAVDVGESVVQRLFGVVGMRIETAGGGSAADVTLDALARDDAAVLRDRLLAARATGTASVDPSARSPRADGGELIRAMSTRELLLAGLTAGQIGPALAIVFGAIQLVDDVLPGQEWGRLVATAPAFSMRTMVILAGAVSLGAWLLAVIGTVLTYGRFELRRDGGRLQISHGLLDRRRGTIPLGRIQALTITEGPLRQPFGLASVRIESAGYGRAGPESGVLFPLVPRSELPELLGRACPELAADLGSGSLQALPERARRRYVLDGVRGVVQLTAAAVGAAALAPWAPWWWGLLVLVLVPPAALHGLLRYRDAGWALDDTGRLTVRSRGIARVTTVTLRRRLQRREVRQHVLQRRARLASFRASIASSRAGVVSIRYLDEDEAFALLARLGPIRRAPVGKGTGGAPSPKIPSA